MDIKIRDENDRDAKRIHRVTELAFRDAPHTDHTEQFIVAALRQAGALVLSRVAESEGKIVGHVALSPVSLSDGSADWFGLGPISVLPEYQGKGIGSKLMENAIAYLRDRGASGCVVLGDPNYYGHFGFKAVEGLVFPGVPEGYFQALSFGGDFPRAEVAYHEAFSTQG